MYEISWAPKPSEVQFHSEMCQCDTAFLSGGSQIKQMEKMELTVTGQIYLVFLFLTLISYGNNL